MQAANYALNMAVLPDADQSQTRRVAIVTDAWLPQVNGVVTTLRRTIAHLESTGHKVLVIHPGSFWSFPIPGYPEIRLALFPFKAVSRRLTEFAPHSIHIATEGPLGLAARRHCLKHSLNFTTAYHTQFPEYLRARVPVPLAWSYAAVRWFHKPASRTMVATPTMRRRLTEHGLTDLAVWERGVDTQLFRPQPRESRLSREPVWICVGRVAVEKNIEAFLMLDLPGRKHVIGAGPALSNLRAKYPEVIFFGYRFGNELSSLLAQGDVFVFPSRTDTFGLVMLEAMACGLPVAAYPVTGPVDVVEQGVTGVLDEDLRAAALKAFTLDRGACREHALTRTWERASEQFAGNLVSVRENSGSQSKPLRRAI